MNKWKMLQLFCFVLFRKCGSDYNCYCYPNEKKPCQIHLESRLLLPGFQLYECNFAIIQLEWNRLRPDDCYTICMNPQDEISPTPRKCNYEKISLIIFCYIFVLCIISDIIVSTSKDRSNRSFECFVITSIIIYYYRDCHVFFRYQLLY